MMRSRSAKRRLGGVATAGKAKRSMRKNHRQRGTGTKPSPRRTRNARKGRELWEVYRENAEVLLHLSTEHEVLELQDEVVKLLRFLTQVLQLYNAFHRQPDGKINGPKGVAELLDISRHGVYVRASSWAVPW